MASSSDQNTTTKPVEPLITRLLDAFWCLENNSLTMTSDQRMVPVVRLLAEEIRSWAPDKGQAKICHLAITEVADRLIREVSNV